MATNTLSQATGSPLRAVLLGAAGGLIGGVVFGLMMGMQNMLPMVGMLIGQDNAVIGFVVHMVISAGFGAGYGLVAPRLPQGWAVVVGAGAAYGVLLWVVGALILMPLMLGMNEMVFVIGDMQIFSLIGHLVFGVLLAAAFKLLRARL